MSRRRLRILGILALAAAILPGCRSAPIEIVERPDFPADRAQGAPMDIQVVRDRTQITLTNTTATNLGPFTLWLNRRFARDLEGLAVGQTRTLNLAEFIDQWGDRFRAGGFFATERPEPVVTADIAPADGSPRRGLVVIRAED